MEIKKPKKTATVKKVAETNSDVEEKIIVSNMPPDPMLGRPWQGTFLGVLSIIALIGLGASLIFSILFTVGGSFFTGYLADLQGMPGLSGFWGFGMMGSLMFLPMILVSLVPLIVLQYYLTKGIFSGKRWTIIVTLVLTGLSALSFKGFLLFIPLLGLFYISMIVMLLYLEIK